MQYENQITDKVKADLEIQVFLYKVEYIFVDTQCIKSCDMYITPEGDAPYTNAFGYFLLI